jgi:hypothetical protein|tara:strand:- start:1804 stop:1983 length:180 start_codon:yes stop_codon:yes gene_type:complete
MRYKDSYGFEISKHLSFGEYWEKENQRLELSMQESIRQREERYGKLKALTETLSVKDGI